MQYLFICTKHIAYGYVWCSDSCRSRGKCPAPGRGPPKTPSFYRTFLRYSSYFSGILIGNWFILTDICVYQHMVFEGQIGTAVVVCFRNDAINDYVTARERSKRLRALKTPSTSTLVPDRWNARDCVGVDGAEHDSSSSSSAAAAAAATRYRVYVAAATWRECGWNRLHPAAAAAAVARAGRTNVFTRPRVVTRTRCNRGAGLPSLPSSCSADVSVTARAGTVVTGFLFTSEKKDVCARARAGSLATRTRLRWRG